tara:strand:+ start:77 stop:292 length:216 start_codon:yes stop_codon:yes gene_type:complete
MEGFERGDIVWIRDRPFGSKTGIFGRVVGILDKDWYNILLQNGLNEGIIYKYKSYKLLIKEKVAINAEEDS